MGFSGNGINAAHLYRSIDAGAHWIDVSSNLPDAPANSVVVDPNDANTLYVALDTGVYVTTEITTCATANCWSVYGTSLPNAPVVVLSAAAAMPTGDGRTGELRAATYGRGLWQIPLLTAATAAQPIISLNPTALTYGVQAVATASAPQTITVTNTGYAPLVVSQVVVSGDFDETDTCTAAPIAVGMACAIQIRFLPTAIGSRSGLLTVYGNVAGRTGDCIAYWNGITAAAIVLTPLTLNFPSTTINSTSAVQNITISNTSSAAVNLQSASVSGRRLQDHGQHLRSQPRAQRWMHRRNRVHADSLWKSQWNTHGHRRCGYADGFAKWNRNLTRHGFALATRSYLWAPAGKYYERFAADHVDECGGSTVDAYRGTDRQWRLHSSQCLRQLFEPALDLLDQCSVRAEECWSHQWLAGRL